MSALPVRMLLAVMPMMMLVPTPARAALAGSGTADDPYIIYTSYELGNDFYNDVIHGRTENKYYKLADNWDNGSSPLHTMLGRNAYYFSGHFDGNGKTVTIDIWGEASESALFKATKNATIKNLTIVGCAATQAKFAASLIAHNYGNTTIENCHSTVAVTSTAEQPGDGTHGGFVAVNEGGATLNFIGCSFCGQLLGGNAGSNGGFVGYNSGTQINYTDCIFAPTNITMSYTNCSTFNRNGKNTFVRTYYTAAYGAAQGWRVYADAPDGLVCDVVTAADGNNYYRPVVVEVKTSYFYRGDVIHPVPSVKTIEGAELEKDTHYTLAYSAENDAELGQYSLTITGLAPYNGSQTIAYEVHAAEEISGLNFNPYDEVYEIPDKNAFTTLANYVNAGHNGSGKTFRQTADIDMTGTEFTPVGSSSGNPFKGVYDGDNKTLTIQLTATENNCAPFGAIYNATIKNLNVTGSITTSAKNAASIAADVWGKNYIENCHSTVDIVSTFPNADTDGTHGGMVALMESQAELYFTNCSFTGRLLGSNAACCGGFVGWENAGSNWGPATIVGFTDCLFAPAEITMSHRDSYTYCRYSSGNTERHFTRAYYVTPIGQAQGTQVYVTPPTEGDYDPLTAADGNTYYLLTTIDGLNYNLEGRYYEVIDKNSLNALASYVNSGHDCKGKTFRQTGDIDMNGTSFTPIGKDAANPFKGTFNGDGYVIKNITHAADNTGLSGLFGVLQGRAENVALTDCSFTAGSVGGIAGETGEGSTISNCAVLSGTLTGVGEGSIGGIAGVNAGAVSGCFTTAAISGAGACYGPVVGSNGAEGTVTTCDYTLTPGLGAGTVNDLGTKVTVYTITFEGGLGAVSEVSGNYRNVGKSANRYHFGKENETVSLVGTPARGYVIHYTSSDVTVSEVEGVQTFTMPAQDVVLSATYTPDPAHFEKTGENEYTIHTAKGWDVFCDFTGMPEIFNNFSGKTVKLDSDIPCTAEVAEGKTAIGKMAGTTAANSFQGTFDGQGHKLTIQYSSSSSHEDVSPFVYIKDATIKNLTVAGSLFSTYAPTLSGLVSYNEGSSLVRNVVVTCNLKSNITHSQVVGGLASNGGGISFEGCVFNSTLQFYLPVGGFCGNGDENTSFTDCLLATADGTKLSEGGENFSLNDIGSVTNSYYIANNRVGTSTQGAMACVIDTKPVNIGSEVTDYGLVKAYDNGLFYNGHYYLTPENVSLPDNEDNRMTISDKDDYFATVTLQDRLFYEDAKWNTLCLPFGIDDFKGTPLEGATVKTLVSTSFENGTLTMHFSDDLTSIEAGKPYIVKWNGAYVINSASDWDAFVQSVANGNLYEGEVVKLAADIPTAAEIAAGKTAVTTMVGTTSYPFKGTFNGLGHTININLTSEGDYTAPFRYTIYGSVTNLHTTGTITTASKFAGGICAHPQGTAHVTSCRSSVNIISSVNGDGTHGGIIGKSDGTINMADCLFDGKLLTTNGTDRCGGLVGWNGSTLSIANSLYAPAEPESGETWVGTNESATIVRNGATITDSYYTKELNDGTNHIHQGSTAIGMSDDELATALGNGWQVSGGKVVPVLNTIVTGNPVFTGVAIDKTARDVETTCVDFKGTYKPVTFTSDDNTKLYIGADDRLYWPMNGVTINACRAFFQLKGLTIDKVATTRMVFNDSTTGIIEIRNERGTVSNGNGGTSNDAAWYTLSGRKLVGKPTAKGLYVNKGRKVVMK